VKGNLLANPSFDSGSFDGWSLLQTGGPYAWDSDNARVVYGREAGGYAYALKLTVQSNNQFRIRNQSYVPVNAGRDYYAGMYAKGGSSNTTLYIAIRYLSSGWSLLECHYVSTTLNTTSYSLFHFSSAPPPHAAYANFGFKIRNAGTSDSVCYVDDAFMYEVDYPVMSKTQTWSNTSGEYDFLNPGNYFRLYNIFAKNLGSSSTLIDIYEYGYPERVFAGFVLPGNSVYGVNFNPPLYSLSTARTRINSSTATGGTVFVRILYNGVKDRSTSDVV
jgi:hypothetical protein